MTDKMPSFLFSDFLVNGVKQIRFFMNFKTDGVKSDDKQSDFFMNFRNKKTVVAMSQTNMNCQARSITLKNMV